jgi:mono/diheme cytochrome c family protein
MHLRRLVIIAIATLAFATACSKVDHPANAPSAPSSAPAASPTIDPFASPRAMFKKDCAQCHGDTGEGKTAVIDGKKIKAPTLRSGHAVEHSDEDFTKQIAKGGDGMPAFEKKMSATEIADMIKFIRKVFQAK